jgi:heterogeneous nuclear ribonucleoprotein G
MRIFIGNLGNDITRHDLFLLFAAFGKVMYVDIATDNENAPLGYAYVCMHTRTDAHQAIATLNKKRFMQQYLSVSEALCNSILCQGAA